MTFSPEQEEKHRRIRKFLIIGAIIAVLLFVTGFCVYAEMLHYVAYHRLETLNANARRVYQHAQAWLDEEHVLTTHIAEKSRSAAPDSFTAYVSPGDYGHWYGIVCDEQGNPLYALYSYKKIPAVYLEAPPKKEDMMEMLNDPFRTGYAVGTWAPENTSPPVG